MFFKNVKTLDGLNKVIETLDNAIATYPKDYLFNIGTEKEKEIYSKVNSTMGLLKVSEELKKPAPHYLMLMESYLLANHYFHKQYMVPENKKRMAVLKELDRLTQRSGYPVAMIPLGSVETNRGTIDYVLHIERYPDLTDKKPFNEAYGLINVLHETDATIDECEIKLNLLPFSNVETGMFYPHEGIEEVLSAPTEFMAFVNNCLLLFVELKQRLEKLRDYNQNLSSDI